MDEIFWEETTNALNRRLGEHFNVFKLQCLFKVLFQLTDLIARKKVKGTKTKDKNKY